MTHVAKRESSSAAFDRWCRQSEQALRGERPTRRRALERLSTGSLKELIHHVGAALGQARSVSSKEYIIREAAALNRGRGVRLGALASLASNHTLDPGRCGLSPAAPEGPGVSDPGRQETDPGEHERQLDRFLRRAAREGRFSKTLTRGPLPAAVITALGRLPRRAARRRIAARGLAGAPARQLRRDVHTAVRGAVAATIQRRARQARSVVDTLLKHRAVREGLLRSRAGVEPRAALLEGLGLSARTAHAIASSPAARDADLVRGLRRTRETLAAMDRFCTGGTLFDEVTHSMFEIFAPVVEKVKRDMGIRGRSFAAEAIRQGVRRGKTIKTVNSVFKTVASICATTLLWATGAGAGTLLAPLAGAALNAGAATLMDGPDVLVARHHGRLADLGGSLGVVGAGQPAAARAKVTRATRDLRRSILIGALTGAAGNSATEASRVMQAARGGEAAQRPILKIGAGLLDVSGNYLSVALSGKEPHER